MKKIILLTLAALLTGCSKEPNVAVRIDCGEYNDKGLQATLNGQPVGDCPVDMMVHAGEVYVSARKDKEDASYLFAEAKMTLAENAMKRIKLDIQPIYTEEYYYRKATDLPGMHAYLKGLSDGKRRNEIKDNLEQYYFDKATDLAGMQAYLKELSDGKRRNEINDKLEQYYFDKATDLAGMQAYLDNQPDGKRKVDVETKLKAERGKLDNVAPGLVMMPIPAGSFMMGCSEGDSECSDAEKPRHEVTVPAFKLSKTEVTFAQYDAFAKATKRELPKDEGWGRGKRPVINVSWYDAVAYTRWLSEQTGQKFRLPSEAEWEYAVRAGTSSKYSWGNAIDCSKASYNGGESSSCFLKTKKGNNRGTAAVGSFSANSFGLHDMHGNVLEWVQDCWNDNYSNAPTNGKSWQTGNCDRRVNRGGSWIFSAAELRASNRGYITLGSRGGDYLGFRVAQD